MTNAMIIWNAKHELAEAGVIKYTGRMMAFTLPDGSVIEEKETEDIHTFLEWKKAGYMV